MSSITHKYKDRIRTLLFALPLVNGPAFAAAALDSAAEPGYEWRPFVENELLGIAIVSLLLLLFLGSITYLSLLLIRRKKDYSSEQLRLERRVNFHMREVYEERQKLNQAQAIAHIGSYVWDVENNITTWSDELYRIFGYEPGEIEASHSHFVDRIHEEDKKGFLQLTSDVIANRKPYTSEYRIERPDGEIRYVHEQLGIKLDDKGQLRSMVSVIQDITDRILDESRLRSERDFNESVLETADNVIVILDMNACFVRFNRAAELLTGYSRYEVLGKPVWDTVIPPEQIDAVKQVFENLRRGKVDIAGQYQNDWVMRDGSRRTLEWRNSALHNDKGEVTHIVTLGYDLTERLAAQSEQERLHRELNQARKMEALGQLTGGIAHDFNNMLGIVIGYNELAMDEFGELMNETLLDYHQNINTASHRARELVKQMMVFSKSKKTEKQPMQLQPLIEENIAMLRSVIPSSVKIHFEYENDLPNVMVDPIQVQQALMNLCLNARDAMQGVGMLNIKLGMQHGIDRECNACHKIVRGSWLELSVSDDGSGMEGEVMERIFEPFFTTKDVGQGTGMGMSVLHAIMDGHSGHIFIDTQKKRGTCFRLVFPGLSLSPADALPEIREPQPAYRKGNGEHILVVDDEPVLVDYLYLLLSGNGYQCTKTCSSPEALSMIQQNPQAYNMVITDHTMPDLTGTEMIRRLRAIREDIPVILVTGYSDTVDMRDTDLQDITLLDKPLDSGVLLRHVAERLAAATLRQSHG